MMKKKLLIIPLALLLTVSLVACASPAPAPAPAPAPTVTVEVPGTAPAPAPAPTVTVEVPAPAPAPAPAPEKKSYRFILATEAGTKGTPAADSVDMLARLIEEATDGRIEVDVFYQGELGGPQEMFDQLLKSNIDIELSWPITSYDPRMATLNVPYTVFTWEDALEAYSAGGWLNQVVDPVFGGLNLKFFGSYPEGFNGIATKGAYATNPEQAGKIKLRSQPILPYPQSVEAMGYQAVVIDWSEVYTSIQTGIVDGDSGNVIFWDQEYFGDLIDYYVWTKHIFQTGTLLMAMDDWNSLDAEDQQILTDAADQMLAKHFGDAEGLDLKYRQQAIDKGIEFIELTPAEFALHVQLVRDAVWPLMDEKIGTFVMNQIRAGAAEPPE